MTVVIAERKLDHGDAQDVGCAKVFMPELKPRGEWRCDYEISWPGFRHAHWTAGVDSWQAIELAMRSVVADIELTDDFKTGRLGSLGQRLTTYAELTEAFGVRPFKVLEQ